MHVITMMVSGWEVTASPRASDLEATSGWEVENEVENEVEGDEEEKGRMRVRTEYIL